MAKIEIKDIADKLELLNEKFDKLSIMVTVGAPDEYLTIQGAAQFLNVSVGTLYKKVHYRKLPFIKNGKILRFRKSDLIMFLESNLQVPYNG